jgi:ribosomal protein S18 acetylase RimI-like enzyme
VHVRPADLADLDALRRVAEQSFRETFADVNRAEDMDAYCAASFGADTLAAELAEPRSTFWMATAAEEVGYAKTRAGSPLPPVSAQRGPSAVHSLGPHALELERIYVLRSHLGRGVGYALLEAAVQHARSHGHPALWLGVWEHNTRALAFYRRNGFVDVGAKPFVLGADLQTDRVLLRRL